MSAAVKGDKPRLSLGPSPDERARARERESESDDKKGHNRQLVRIVEAPCTACHEAGSQ